MRSMACCRLSGESERTMTVATQTTITLTMTERELKDLQSAIEVTLLKARTANGFWTTHTGIPDILGRFLNETRYGANKS